MRMFGGVEYMTAEDFPPEGQESIISGGISGAITDIGCERANKHAFLYYEEMRHNRNSDVEKIAKNTGFSKEQILQIKHYLFIDEHCLDGEYKRFTPSFEIAQSWQRLASTKEQIKPHDLTLLNHELMEVELIAKGISQSEAHIITSRKYNYPAESSEYYKSLGVKIETDKDQNSGGIKRVKKDRYWEERY